MLRWYIDTMPFWVLPLKYSLTLRDSLSHSMLRWYIDRDHMWARFHCFRDFHLEIDIGVLIQQLCFNVTLKNEKSFGKGRSSYKLITLDPHLVDTLLFMDTPSLWTLFPHVNDRHLCELGNGTIVCNLWPMATSSFTSVDTSLLWTLFVRPLGVHITEVLLYNTFNWCMPTLYVHKY